MAQRQRPIGFDFIDDLPVTPPEPCPYLPDRHARYRAFTLEGFSPQAYHRLMDAAFRRSGDCCYQPVCDDCQKCVPIRVRAATFQPTASQRRVSRRNRDLTIDCGAVSFTGEKFQLYSRYCERWHGKADADEDAYRRFLVDSPVDTIEFRYRDATGRLLAVGVCDVCPLSLSSVYFFFDPDEHRRSLGTFGALVELAWAARNGIPHYYLGYWVAGSATMDYKSRFGPHELLSAAGWVSSGAGTED